MVVWSATICTLLAKDASARCAIYEAIIKSGAVVCAWLPWYLADAVVEESHKSSCASLKNVLKLFQVLLAVGLAHQLQQARSKMEDAAMMLYPNQTNWGSVYSSFPATMYAVPLLIC